VIRDAASADVPALVELEETCQGGDAWSQGLVADGVGGGLPTISWTVAEAADGATLLGYAVASYAGDVAELQRIGVAPDARRQGVARDLLADVVRRAREARAERVLLEVREDNAGALAFYAGQGFGELSRRPRYYRDGATAVVLSHEIVTDGEPAHG
jgi:ribosomal-protein-alanine N-acetyltransferase